MNITKKFKFRIPDLYLTLYRFFRITFLQINSEVNEIFRKIFHVNKNKSTETEDIQPEEDNMSEEEIAA